MTGAAARQLLDVLAARRGLVCVVGAGGKKTTLYRLVEAHLAAGTARIGLTCTVAMAPPPKWLGEPVIAEGPDAGRRARPARAASDASRSTPSPRPNRGGSAACRRRSWRRLHDEGGFEVTLIKADGARMRWIKAPAMGEPVLPPGVATVLPLVSARVFGQPLSEAIAHRLERVTAVTGAQPGAPVTPEHVARLLSSEHGALQGVGGANVVPVINMVDDQATREAAREAARLALATSSRLAQVVLARMIAPDPVIEVVTL